MIYFIGIEGTNYVKVGHAGRPQRRLAELATGHPMDLVLLHTIECGNSPVMEKRIHKFLVKEHVKREWFTLTPERLIETVNHFASGIDYAENPVIDGYLYLRAQVERVKEGHLQTVTEPCFFCHKAAHWHGAIDTVRIEGNLQSYGHRVAHCDIKGLERKHPSGQILNNDKGYYLWIENPATEQERREKLKPYACYVGQPEYRYMET